LIFIIWFNAAVEELVTGFRVGATTKDKLRRCSSLVPLFATSRVSNFKKKKPIWPRLQRKPRPKGIEFKKKNPYGLGWNENRGQKAGLYGLWFH